MMNGWQPIETAPKGKDVLVCWARWARWGTMRVLQQGDGFWYDKDDARYATPSHWMPLPDPPQLGEGQ